MRMPSKYSLGTEALEEMTLAELGEFITDALGADKDTIIDFIKDHFQKEFEELCDDEYDSLGASLTDEAYRYDFR